MRKKKVEAEKLHTEKGERRKEKEKSGGGATAYGERKSGGKTTAQKQFSKLRPAIGSPSDGTLNEHGGSVLRGTVAMTDEDVLSIEIVGSTMSGSLPFFLVTFQEDSATTICHVLACAVKIWSFNVFAAPNSHAVVALCTTAAIVPRHEEIKEVAVLEDERSFYGVCARIL